MESCFSAILLSIKPEYVEEIILGEKIFEFRKRIWRKSVKIVAIYSSAPIKKIIGYFIIDEIIKGTPKEIWHHCKEGAGITKEDFFNYFRNKEMAFAIKIGRLEIFEVPIIPLEVIKDFKAPQSFMYLEGLVD